MSDLTRLMGDWLTIVAKGDFDAWDERVAPDIVLRLPYAPAGVVNVRHGFNDARESLRAFWTTWARFDFLDAVIRRTEDPELVVTTTRSEAMTIGGKTYENDYVMFTRFQGGRVVEHTEYFNPLQLAALFSD